MSGCSAGIALMAVIGSAGCASPSDEGPGSPPLILRLEAPDEARAGDRVHLALKITNDSKRTIDQPFGGQPAHDFVVTRTNGTQVWRWSTEQIVRDVLELKTLPPGQVLAFEADWNQRDDKGRPVPPGTYLVRGLLNTEPPAQLETMPKPIVITP